MDKMVTLSEKNLPTIVRLQVCCILRRLGLNEVAKGVSLGSVPVKDCIQYVYEYHPELANRYANVLSTVDQQINDVAF